MEQLAQGLASLGRNGDSMLVHMTPKEVQGLQQLALAKGGSLTINPQTGLPEAFNLGDVFEFAAPILGGMAFGPIGAGLAGGLTSYARHGDLGKAALSGALGWGLGSIGEGIENMGGKALGDTSTATGLGRDLITQNSPINAETFGSMPSDLPGAVAYQTEDKIPYYLDPNNPGQWTTSNIAANTPTINPEAVSATNMPGYYNTNPPSYADKMGAGLKQLGTTQGWKDLYSQTGMMPIAAAGLGLAGMMSPQQTAMAGPQAQTGYAPRYTYNPQTRRYETAAPAPYTYYAANGGSVPNTFPQSNIEQMAYSKSSANPMPTNVVGIPSSDYDARINQQGDVFTAAGGGRVERKRYVEEDTGVGPYSMSDDELDAMKYILKTSPVPKLASGGIASLGEYAAGGKLLQGPGDGMSDSIPAVIKGGKPQRAALAQGEFVVPADVVSHLGNGSTDAGAKRLYAMMDKVRMARTGNKKQGRQINPEKFMPA